MNRCKFIADILQNVVTYNILLVVFCLFHHFEPLI